LWCPGRRIHASAGLAETTSGTQRCWLVGYHDGMSGASTSVRIGDVAKRAGTSVATVSHVLRGTGKFVSDRLADRVRRAAQDLGYRPNSVASALRTRRTRSIGVVVPDLRDYSFMLLLKGCTAAAQAYGFSLILEDAEGSWAREAERTRHLLDRRVEGLVVAPVGNRNPVLPEAVRERVPVVLVGSDLPDVAAPVVLADIEAGTAAAMAHLWERGYRRPALVAGALDTALRRECFAAYGNALAQRHQTLDPSLVITQPSDLVGGYKAMMQLLHVHRPPDAVFVAGHSMALGAVKALRRSSVPCPAQIAVVAVGDYEWAAAMTPSLTVVSLPAYDMGYQAVALLAAATAPGERTARPPTTDVLRNSSGLSLEAQPPECQVLRLPTQLIVRGSSDPAYEGGFWDATGVAV
jgi:LacI family transcriptional regulator